MLRTAVLVAALAAGAGVPIQVSGTGTVSVMPDEAIETFTVSTYGAGAAGTLSQNNRRVARFEAALARFGITGSAIDDGAPNVSYQPPPNDGAKPVEGAFYGFTVSRTVTVTVRALKEAGPVLDAAVAAGVANVDSVSFARSDERAQTRDALALAVADARSKAEAIARGAHLRLVRIRRIDEGAHPGVFVPSPAYDSFALRTAAVPTRITPQALSVQATVTAVFEAR